MAKGVNYLIKVDGRYTTHHPGDFGIEVWSNKKSAMKEAKIQAKSPRAKSVLVEKYQEVDVEIVK